MESSTPQLFEWHLPGPIVVVDNGGRLASQQNAATALDHDNVEFVVLDAGGRFNADMARPGGEKAQYLFNVSLGNGAPTALHICANSAWSATLAPIPDSLGNDHTAEDAREQSQASIQTLALDTVDELSGVDWLVLDANHDNLAILDHGAKTLVNSLLIQVCVPFIATHQNQTSFEAIQCRLAGLGFIFYRFERLGYVSHFSANEQADKTCASQLQAADALFVPNEQRRQALSADASEKLAFLLDMACGAHDLSYRLLSAYDDVRARHYLLSHGYLSTYDDEPDTFTLTAAYSPAPWDTEIATRAVQ